MANLIDTWCTDKCYTKFEAISDSATVAVRHNHACITLKAPRARVPGER
jgi:hypothetical protein